MITINIHLNDLPIASALAEVEKRIIKYAMEQSGFNQTKAAALLEMNRATFRARLKKYYKEAQNHG